MSPSRVENSESLVVGLRGPGPCRRRSFRSALGTAYGLIIAGGALSSRRCCACSCASRAGGAQILPMTISICEGGGYGRAGIGPPPGGRVGLGDSGGHAWCDSLGCWRRFLAGFLGPFLAVPWLLAPGSRLPPALRICLHGEASFPLAYHGLGGHSLFRFFLVLWRRGAHFCAGGGLRVRTARNLLSSRFVFGRSYSWCFWPPTFSGPTNMRDAPTDAEAGGERTLVVRYGGVLRAGAIRGP